jgi:hypothetical protein
MTDRRFFIKTLAVAGAASLAPDLSVFGQTVNKLKMRGGAIDVHHHFNAPGQSTGPPFAAMKAFMPESQILFGTDYAPEPIESTVDSCPA